MRASHLGRGLHNVPAEFTSFVGRRRELTEIKRQLSGSRLLTLTGSGGVGKTRLALRASVEVQRGFDDGVWLVELASLEDPALLTQAVFAALGLRDQSARWLVATLSDYLAKKQLLLVIDNCEHLLSACAVLVDTLLRACPGLRILATSRQALGMMGETTFPVPSLSVSDEAVTLFAERATAVLPDFQMVAGNRATIVAICEQLDGIPLAIELAAARLRALTLGDILERLDDRFLLLSRGNRAATPRQQTLKATIEWSFGLASEQEQVLWRRLSVFAGGFDLAAAEQVCAGEGLQGTDVLESLTGLLEKSILLGTPGDVHGRYQMFESIRAFGKGRLVESGEELPFRMRHRDWIAGLVKQAEREWRGPNQARWLDRIEAEHGNLRAALDFCLADPGRGESGLEIAGGLWPFWRARGMSEGRRWLEALLDSQPGPTPARAKALAAAGLLATARSDAETALVLLPESLALAQKHNMGQIAAFALRYLSGAALLRGELGKSAALAKEARDMYQTTGDRGGMADALLELAVAESMQGKADEAITHYEESITLTGEIGEQSVRSFALWGLAIELLRRHQHQKATQLQRESLRLKHALDDRVGIALNIEVLAWIAASEGRAERAAVLLGAVKTLWDSIPAALFGPWTKDHEECEASTRSHLESSAFDAAYRRGLGMPAETTVAFALEERVEAASPRPRREESGVALTHRETTIADLVAEGLTNKQIASKLVLSERTVETHVVNILNKLGFNSRSQVASWFAKQQRSVLT